MRNSIAATIAPARSDTQKASVISRKPSEETAPAALCDRDRLLAALANGPILSKEEGELILRVVQEAREASIAGPFD